MKAAVITFPGSNCDRDLAVAYLYAGKLDEAEPLYRRLGWQQGGRIPGYALDEAGQAHDTLYFYKHIG